MLHNTKAKWNCQEGEENKKHVYTSKQLWIIYNIIDSIKYCSQLQNSITQGNYNIIIIFNTLTHTVIVLAEVHRYYSSDAPPN